MDPSCGTSGPRARKYDSSDREWVFGTVVLNTSTPPFVMTARDAFEKGIGGEVLFKVTMN